MEYYPAEFFSVYSAVCDQDLLRTLARAPVGSSLARYITNQNPERLSKLPAIGMNGVLALTVQDNTFNTKKFQHFLELGCRVRALCEEAGVRVICLPPYCPELNPIELCFARMKFRLQQMQELSYSLDTHCLAFSVFSHRGTYPGRIICVNVHSFVYLSSKNKAVKISIGIQVHVANQMCYMVDSQS
ncbi:hypothetical protein PSTG_13573 [Puccinia striiformis f. sp. tritici PST-78]|uniref:Tc1-like transposase DDE domain-containing protein n=1 Tax=Puccinia striiformis f. sp. tritici PST-78 TaxID=1165861 RepID=A0A0L0V1A1_9BASI|nr:hypothetical protein PSTG_13573 [Puccinia striiformis f. sp. tritici PST-78]